MVLITPYRTSVLKHLNEHVRPSQNESATNKVHFYSFPYNVIFISLGLFMSSKLHRAVIIIDALRHFVSAILGGFSFENAICADYITEKTYNALRRVILFFIILTNGQSSL